MPFYFLWRLPNPISRLNRWSEWGSDAASTPTSSGNMVNLICSNRSRRDEEPQHEILNTDGTMKLNYF